MFENLTVQQKEEKFAKLLDYANKINNKKLHSACLWILNDYKSDILCRNAGHDGIESIPAGVRTHQNFDGGRILSHLCAYHGTKPAAVKDLGK